MINEAVLAMKIPDTDHRQWQQWLFGKDTSGVWQAWVQGTYMLNTRKVASLLLIIL
jgi:hypothetical protein